MAQSLAAVFVGSDTLLLQCLQAWLERGHAALAVATDADKVRSFCADHGVRCLDAGGDWAREVASERIDHVFAVTWLRLLPDAVLRLPQRSAINFHDGPLPRYAGLNATCWAILHGETEHAITWHRIERKTDTGDVLLQRRFPIAADDTAFTLNARCFQAGIETFAELMAQLEVGGPARTPQDLAQRSYFGRHARPEALAVLDLAGPAAVASRLVRAFDHGGYRNPVAIAKLRLPHGVCIVGACEALPASRAPAGTVLTVADEAITVAVADADLRLSRLRCLRGSPLAASALRQLGAVVGTALPLADAATRAQWTRLGAAAAPADDAWVDELRDPSPLPAPDGARAGATAAPAALPVTFDGVVDPIERAAWCAAFLARAAASDRCQLGVATAAWAQAAATAPGMVVAVPPVRLLLPAGTPVGDAVAAAAATLRAATARGPLLRELVVRRSDAIAADVALEPPVRLALAADVAVAPGTLAFDCAGDGVVLRYDVAAVPEAAVLALAARLQVFVRAARANPQSALAATPILGATELQRLLRDFNATDAPAPAEPRLHRQFAAAASARPDAVALTCGDASATYRQLHAAVERLAGWLRGRGVQPGDRVGVCTRRGVGMVTAVLATLRCGAAYVPLDPGYPQERLQFMAQDAELAALVVDAGSAAAAPTASCPRVDLDADAAAIAGAAPLTEDAADGESLAYLIYTSGSTGRPKGVMVRHRNVANFFAGMDRVLGTEPGTWLAVTSLSFDISVLELLWTLCRGFHVVVHAGDGGAAVPVAPAAARPVAFSLFYFASDEGEHAQDKYRLLLDGARFADAHGFEAVWTPERHFHAFGGLYPNPAVASAALATITQHVAIRAGSCVVTLHHPVRVAEDWALVDNLSRGRVGIAFAAGWHARDFVLRPESFADRKNGLVTSMRQVQALWRGEAIEFPGPDGKPHAIRTLPRPVQKELPSWVTIAGNPETYRIAGASGSYVLTHLLGQSLEELTGKLAIYRQAWREAGHPGEGKVTLMLHTFVGDSDEQVRAIVREPMKGYLRSSLDLVKQAAWSFPAFKNRVDKPGELDALLNGGLTPADFDALLDFSFERYYRTSGLFGSPEQCVAIVDKLRAMQIDEIACLVDFGIPSDVVMHSLPKLLEVKRRCDAATARARAATAAAPASTTAPATIPQLLTSHAVTHFQCTPSMAAMLLVDPEAPAAFRGLRAMLVGGEALSGALARHLRALVPALHDVYGPTETTVWSTTMPVGDEESVPIGRPLANQRCYVLDANLQPVPMGSPGELWIGGAGVTAGYFRRPELTEERFRPDPFVPGGRVYGTGDLARWRADGVLEYLGRKDHQVKVRGYRIELGEIEAALQRHPGVREGVVVARTDGSGGEPRLVAYYVARSPAPSVDDLRASLRQSLPDFMVPAFFVALADLPRTPNLKVDRKALPAPEAAAAGARAVVAAGDEIEAAILAIWRQALGVDAVGVEDNFFDSGGQSILAVRVHREIVQKLGVELAVTDLFRFPTIRGLARHLQAGASTPTAAQLAAERAKQRRNILRR